MMEPPSAAAIFSPASADSLNGPFQVHVQHLVVKRFGHVGQLVVQRRHAGVVHQHVEPAETLFGQCQQALVGLPVTRVVLHGQGCAAAVGLDLRRQRLAVVQLAAGDDHAGTGPGKGQADFPADSPAATGNDGNPPFQILNR